MNEDVVVSWELLQQRCDGGVHTWRLAQRDACQPGAKTARPAGDQAR